MRPRSTCVILATGLFIGPLAWADDKAPHTVSWYLAHAATREKTALLCQDDPGEAGHTRDCLNALTASTIDCGARPRLYQQFNHCGPLGSLRARVMQREIEAPSQSLEAAIARIP